MLLGAAEWADQIPKPEPPSFTTVYNGQGHVYKVLSDKWPHLAPKNYPREA